MKIPPELYDLSDIQYNFMRFRVSNRIECGKVFWFLTASQNTQTSHPKRNERKACKFSNLKRLDRI